MPLPQQPGASGPLTPAREAPSPLPTRPQAAASIGLLTGEPKHPILPNAAVEDKLTDGLPEIPTSTPKGEMERGSRMRLELEDGAAYEGFGFGAGRSIAGELVFQTGMVGYPESITDPSYRGQILVVTFPLIGNYGVPSRHTLDEILHNLPAHFEATQIHVSGLVVASYSGEDYSHHLATSSLGTWLKEQNVPAMCGVDTRALTKRIRQEGSMLGKLLAEVKESHEMVNGHLGNHLHTSQPTFDQVEWIDPNTRNLVADGESALPIEPPVGRALTFIASLHTGTPPLLSACESCVVPSLWPSYQGIVR